MFWIFVVAALIDVVTTYFARRNGAIEWNPLLKRLPYKMATSFQIVLYLAIGAFFKSNELPCIAQVAITSLPVLAASMNLHKFFKD